MLHRARCKYRTQIVVKNRHVGTIAQLCRATSSQLRHISTIGKNFLSSNISSTCSRNTVNFGLLAAEIDPVVWGTPANFNGFRVLAALLHGTAPIFGRAAIRLGIGPHSSLLYFIAMLHNKAAKMSYGHMFLEGVQVQNVGHYSHYKELNTSLI